MNILDTNTSYLYGWKDIETSMFNIGSKTPDGTPKLSYVTSLSNDEWWERFGLGKMRQTILFVGDEQTAKALEWFALDYGIAVKSGQFYNAKNNAHRGDQSLLTVEMKQIVIDYIEGRGNGIQILNSDEVNNKLIMQISDNIEKNIYPQKIISLDVINKYDKSQVRAELLNETSVSTIKKRMEENPEEARKVFKPIVVVVQEDGTECVLDGNTRLAAATRARGWKEVPVVFINYTEFGSTEETRKENYVTFGLYANKENFEFKSPNSKEDFKRIINNLLVANKIDLSKPLHIDHARQLIYNKYAFVTASKQQLNGVLTSIITDFEKTQANLKYQGNLITYSDAFFKKYCWDNYGIKDIATVTIKVSEAAHGKGIGYILRRMKNVNASKGAIIFHYTKKEEIQAEATDNWIQDTKDTIAFSKLPITVEVLPAFKE
jgi:GTPase SAR1 family protein